MDIIEVPRVVRAGVAVLLWNYPVYKDSSRLVGEKQLLMGKRKGSHGAGTWSLPGGWMEFGESFTEAGKREVKEETSLEVFGMLRVVSVANTIWHDQKKHAVTILLEAKGWSGEPKVMEPDKLDGEWQWFEEGKWPSPLFEPLLSIDLFTGAGREAKP